MTAPLLNRRRFLTLSGAALAGFGPARGRACPVLTDDKPDPLKAQKELANGINAFAADLFRRLAGEQGSEKGSLFVSPFSVETALGMTSAGARGVTLDEMRKALHLPADPHPAFGALLGRLSPRGAVQRPYELSTANAIWAQQGFPWERPFADLTREHYGTGLRAIDFAESDAARRRINGWVADETRRKVKDLIAEGVITALTRMVLANAVYFKSDWRYRFDPKRTRDAKFTRDDGTTADVRLMALTGKLNHGALVLGGRCGVRAEVLELPYAGNDLSMLVFLPEKGVTLDRLVERMGSEHLGAPKLAATEVRVFLPRFKAETALSLKPHLEALGMKKAFADADFTGLSSEGKRLSVSHVLHKAFVDVTEEGTEAAAATAVVIAERAAEPVVFRADRPFVYAIRDNATGAALFLGRYVGPA